jgi:hypothetical protein
MTQIIMAHFDGKVLVPDAPVQLPVGRPLRVQVDTVDSVTTPVETTMGIRDEDWPTDTAGIARLLALIDGLEPFDMSAAEEAEWRAALQAQKDFDKSKFEERARRLEKLFE